MSIDHQARLDVHELLARFCHALDGGDILSWRALFTGNAVFECGEGVRFEGSEALAVLLERIRECSGADHRHLVTAVTIDRGANWRDLKVAAYGPVIDLRNGGVIAEFYDYAFEMRFCNQWRIRSVTARQVGTSRSLLAPISRASATPPPFAAHH